MDAQITLKNGDLIKVNDHIYFSAPWSAREGTPYSIARVMEFLPPEKIGKETKGKHREKYTRARLAWYYRPMDVSDRAVADQRLLLAAIYSEICDISHIRARCYVLHRDKLSDVSGWKKLPDHFYFHRLFDPYIKKEFEILLAPDVRNLPVHIKEILVSRYEYVVAEKEVVPDLTDSLRLCETCGEWCPNLDAVQCDSCKLFFHMGCVTPPLLAKPSRGYGWTCAPCSRQHEDKVGGRDAPINGSNSKPGKHLGVPTRGRGRPRKDKSLPGNPPDDSAVKHYKLWPFRYFGLYTVADDTLDPNDLIFPRAATRVGAKYQISTLPVAAPTPKDSYTGAYPDEIRGGDDTVEIMSSTCNMTHSEVERIEAFIPTLAARQDNKWQVDWITEVVRRICNAKATGQPIESITMKNPMRALKWKNRTERYTDREWNDDEIAGFEDGISLHGAELRLVQEQCATRTIPEVIRFYGKWKNARLREENNRINNPSAYSRIRTKSPPAAQNDDDESIIDVPVQPTSYCASCRRRDSEVWWKAPKGLFTEMLCDSCGTNWRKYADLSARPIREENATLSKVRGEKREGTPINGVNAKRPRVSSVSVVATPPPETPSLPEGAPTQCTCCFNKHKSSSKLLRCKQCAFLVHAGACGAASTFNEDREKPKDKDKDGVKDREKWNWTCDLCSSEKSLDSSLDTRCLLCPRHQQVTGKKEVFPPSDSFLRACKPTEGQGWVHVLCSVFMPELSFADSSVLRLVEGISTIKKHRWTSTCTLCGEAGGAVVKCHNCPKEYHVSCAWKFGHKFGFELLSPSKNARKEASQVNFKGETGVMTAVISCKDHPQSKRSLYEICETNAQGQTALELYCQTYKQVPKSNSHALLRKALRLDQVQGARIVKPPRPIIRELNGKCLKCGSTHSPTFYPMKPKALTNGTIVNGSATTNGVSRPLEPMLCHACYWQELVHVS